MIINHNIAALNTHRQLSVNTANQSKNIEKLSSGLRINRAGDDAAGLAISEKMRGQIRGLDQASRNAQDGISLIQTAEGALNETHSILQRMRELAVQGANDTNTATDRGEIQKEMNQLTSEINRIANTTEFNTKKVLDGGKSAATGASGATGGAAAKAAAITGDSAVYLSGTLSGTVGTLKVTVDGKDYTISSGTLSALGSGFSGGDLVNALKGATNASGATLSGVADVSIASGKITITSKTTGSGSNVTFDAIGSGASGIAKAFGIKDAATATGTAAGSGTSATSFAAPGVSNGTDNNAVESALDVSTHANATNAIDVIDKAIEKVSAERSKLGAFQNRLEHTINNLGTSSENLTAAESRVRDVDMAKEMMEQTKNSILAQAAQAMLAQANQQPQGVLQLLR